MIQQPAPFEARRHVKAVAEQILVLDHDVAETLIRNMMRRSGGISACRSPKRALPSLKGCHPALAGDAASASRPGDAP
jgi:hypothetical protein